MFMVGISEILILLLTMGGPFNQFLGLPPGERDANLVHVAPHDSLLYVEWAARGKGKPGAPGIDGLAADPEVVVFFDRLSTAIENMIARNTGVEQIETMQNVPSLAIALTGKPGCLFWGLDTEAVAKDTPPQFAIAMAIRAGLVINAGDEVDAISDSIKALIAMGTGQEPERLDHTPLPLPAPVQIHRQGNYLILAAGQNAIDDIIARLEGKAGGISNHQSFAAGWKNLGVERVGLLAFLDIENGLQKIGDLTGMRPQFDQGLQLAGMGGAKWAMSVTGVSDSQLVSRGHMHGVSGDQGLMALVSGRGIKADDLALVPDDSDVVFAFSADGRKIVDALKTFLASMDPSALDDYTSGYDQFAEYLGIDFDRDVFAALDHVITISNSPGDGGLIATSPVLTIGIRNVDDFANTATKIADVLQREFTRDQPIQFRRRGVVLERRDFMDTEIFMINTIGEDDVPIAPAWCLTQTHVMIALHPQALKSRLRRLKADDWKSFGDKFTDVPAGEIVSYSAVDVPNVLPQVYGFLPWIAQIAFSEMQSEGLEMNLFDFPSVAALRPYMIESRSFLVRTPNGISKHSQGPPIFAGMPSLTPLLFMSGRAIQPVEVQLQAVEAADEVLIE